MKRTTLIIDKQLLADLTQMAAARGQTLPALADEFLREGLQRAHPGKHPKPRPLPRGKNMGRELVNIADRNALYDVFDRDSTFLTGLKPPRP